MAEERVVVEVDLGVEREDLAVVGEDEGIDFGERGVGVDESAVRAPALTGAALLRGFAGKPDAEGQFARLIRLQADGRVEWFRAGWLRDLSWRLLRFPCRRRAGHEDDFARGAVEQDAEVEFALDVAGLLRSAGA